MDSTIGTADDSSAEKITVTIREYGNVVMMSNAYDIDNPILAKMREADVARLQEILDICGDAEIVENFHAVEGPVIDPLGRMRPYGWYGRFASANYDKLSAHFACRRNHIPEIVTLEFINEMIERYAAQQDDYDDD